jgi:hypothetical protein
MNQEDLMARPNIFALTLVGALASSACMGTVRLEQSLPTTVAPLSTVKTLEVTGEDGAVLLRGTLNGEPTNNERNGKSVRTATLANPSGPAPSGAVEIRIVRENGVSDEEVIVKLREMPYPSVCRLLADGKEIAIFSTSDKGEAEMKLNRRVTGTER